MKRNSRFHTFSFLISLLAIFAISGCFKRSNETSSYQLDDSQTSGLSTFDPSSNSSLSSTYSSTPASNGLSIPGSTTSAISTTAPGNFPFTAAPTAQVAPEQPDPLELYIASLFATVLGRQPNQQEMDYWLSSYGSGQIGVRDVARAFLLSEEKRRGLVNNYYSVLLGRAPQAQELSFWAQQLQTSGEESVIVGLLASDEFYARAGGKNANFVTRLYNLVLGRQPDGPGYTQWMNALNTQDRRTVSIGFIRSSEFIEGFLISFWVNRYFGRTATDAEKQTLRSQIQGGGSWLDIQINMLTSREYIVRVLKAAGITVP